MVHQRKIKKIYEIQEILINYKPYDVTVFHYMQLLYQSYKTGFKTKALKNNQKFKNEKEQSRSAPNSYISEQNHNKVQNKLIDNLSKRYGNEKVFVEENYVDVMVVLEKEIQIYEVKSNPYPHYCIREGLGQILNYAYNLNTKKEIRLYIVGQYQATQNELEYINYIKSNLKINFEYISQEL